MSKKHKGMTAVLSTEFGFSEWNDLAQEVLNKKK